MTQPMDPRYWSTPAPPRDRAVSTGIRRRTRDAAGHFIKYRSDQAAERRRLRRRYREQFSRLERRGEEYVRVWMQGAVGFRMWSRTHGQGVAA